MKKIDPVVLKETKYIALWTLIFSVLLQAVFLIADYFIPDYDWHWTMLTGNLLTGVAVVANFFVMAMDVVRAVEKEEKEAKQTMKLSSSLRFLALGLIILIGALLPDCFNLWAVLIPLLFPRAAILIRPLWDKKNGQEEAEHEE